MATYIDSSDLKLRRALEANGQRFTEQRAAVYRFLAHTDVHPTADEVFLAVREQLPGISLATVYKNLETLVGCGLAVKLTFPDESARYDGCTEPHHHAHCLSCGRVMDIEGSIAESELDAVRRRSRGFTVTGYHLQLSGYCAACVPERSSGPAIA